MTKTAGERSAEALERVASACENYLPLILRALQANAPAAPPGEEVAPDSDLDGQYGDPVIRKDPNRWNGESFANRHMSDAPPEYLDQLAEFFAWKAGKNADDAAKEHVDQVKKGKLEKYAKYARTDAARARGWARRKRNGWVPRGPAQEDLGGGAGDDDFGAPVDDVNPFAEIPF